MEYTNYNEGWAGYSCMSCGHVVHFDKNMDRYPKCPICKNMVYDTEG